MISPQEARHGLINAPNIYAFIDQAARKAKGQSVSERLADVGALMEGFTKVASAQPEHAWFPTERSASELVTTSSENRIVGYPYNKYVNAIMDVDQSASVLIMSEAEAARLEAARLKARLQP